MAVVQSWGSISLLHYVVSTLNHLAGQGQPLPVVRYRAKVKLHGTNCGVQVTGEGVVSQSRTAILTPEDDLKGFAKWIEARRSYFEALRKLHGKDLVVFGEWAGPGVEKGMAVSALPRKVFAVFAVQVGLGEGSRLVVEPEEIEVMLMHPGREIYVLPWEGEDVTLDFASREDLEEKAAQVNERVDLIEREDPWIRRTFNVSGVGEGLVFYPMGVPALNHEAYFQLMWKAKGEKHRTAGAKVAAQVDATVVASAEAFADLMVTEARLEQGVSVVCGGEADVRKTGPFLAWLVADVEKESGAELAASGLTWGQVKGVVLARARDWFKARA